MHEHLDFATFYLDRYGLCDAAFREVDHMNAVKGTELTRRTKAMAIRRLIFWVLFSV